MTIKDILTNKKRQQQIKDNPGVLIMEKLEVLESEVETLKKKLEDTEYELELDGGDFHHIKGDKGDPGEKPIAGIDYPIPQDGNDYILTESDKKDIASQIKIPIVKKVVERTEVIKEQPIITNEIKEVAKYETPEQVADKLNTLTEKVEISVIRGLKKYLDNLGKSIRESKVKVGGGMGNVQHESKAVNSGTTTITTNYNIAGGGFAIWAYYQGQMIVRGTHYTVSGKTLTLTFTPTDNTTVDLIYMRS